MPGEVVLAGNPLVAEEAVAAVVDVHRVEVLRQSRPEVRFKWKNIFLRIFNTDTCTDDCWIFKI